MECSKKMKNKNEKKKILIYLRDNMYADISSLSKNDKSDNNKEKTAGKNHKKGASDKQYTLTSDQLLNVINDLDF
jgi:hypothetical protein